MNITSIHIGSRQEVLADQIKLLVSDINYTTIYFIDGRKVLVSTTMGKIEKRLPTNQFIRINRQTVVNRQAVSHYFIRENYDEVELDDASFLKVSRRRKMETREILNSK